MSTDSVSTDPALIVSIITAAGGIGTAIFGSVMGIRSYRQSQEIKKKDVMKEILFPLIEEFDGSEKMFLAKAILDGFSCNIPELSVKDANTLQFLKEITLEDTVTHKDDSKVFDESRLDETLRDHTEKEVIDKREIAVRASFDAIIDFFVKLEYLHGIHLLEEKQLTYFYYYYDLLARNKAVRNYVRNYGLGLEFYFDTLPSYNQYKKKKQKNKTQTSIERKTEGL